MQARDMRFRWIANTEDGLDTLVLEGFDGAEWIEFDSDSIVASEDEMPYRDEERRMLQAAGFDADIAIDGITDF